MQAVFLHTIDDVKHCLKHGLHKDAKLFSANVNVVYYLKYDYDIECTDLCSYIEVAEYLRIHQIALGISKSLFDELDQQIAPRLNQTTGLSIKYFEPLYSLVGAWQLALFMLLTRFLTYLLRLGQWDGVLIYDGDLGPLNNSIEDFLTKMFPEADCQIVSYKTFYPAAADTEIISNIDFGDILQTLHQNDDSKIPNASLSQQGENSKNVLIFESMDMRQYIQDINISNIYTFNPGMPLSDSQHKFNIGYHNLPDAYCLQSIRLAEKNIQGVLALFYQVVKADFCRNLVPYLQVVHIYKRIHEENPIHYAY
ncbi:MAG: hypothetical protein K0R55_4261, partial [Sporomusa sp.]|nr:hypothetical protein [Sporomusa sp.]